MARSEISTEIIEALQDKANESGITLDMVLQSWLENDTPRIARLARFFDLSLDMLCALNPQCRILTANAAFATAVGEEKRVLEGRPLVDFVTDGDRPDVVAILRNVRNSGNPFSFVCRMKDFDETPRWVLWTLYPRDDGFDGVGKDITPFREMEAKEAERNIFAEALLDTVLAINKSLALEQVLERILSNVGKVVAYDYVTIMLVEGDMAEVAGVQSKQPYHIDVDLVGRESFAIYDNEYLSFMYDSQEVIIVPNVYAPPAWMMSQAIEVAGSFLGTPIVVEEVVIGFLGIFNRLAEFFTPLHAQQLVTFANQAGIAINNARLYEQAQSAAILRERQRMAQELHDSVNQNLFAASTYADLLARAISQKPEAIGKYAADISRLIRSAVAQMRMILIELHPDTLTSTGLEVLIKQLCQAFMSHTGIPVAFSATYAAVLEQEEHIAVYRIAQEALHNIDKHAGASRVTVSLSSSDAHLELVVADDGTGFDLAQLSEVQFGIRGMRERARSIGASLVIDTQPGTSTTIKLTKGYTT